MSDFSRLLEKLQNDLPDFRESNRSRDQKRWLLLHAYDVAKFIEVAGLDKASQFLDINPIILDRFALDKQGLQDLLVESAPLAFQCLYCLTAYKDFGEFVNCADEHERKIKAVWEKESIPYTLASPSDSRP